MLSLLAHKSTKALLTQITETVNGNFLDASMVNSGISTNVQLALKRSLAGEKCLVTNNSH